MKELYLKLWPLGFILLFPFSITAQSSVEGKLNNWTHGEGIIAYFGMFNGEMTQMGSLNAGGDFQIPLDPDFFNSFKELAEKEAAEAPPGVTLSYKTIASTFSCMFEESVTTQNGDTRVTGLPELVLTDKTGKMEFGILYAVSSPEVAGWLRSYGEEGISPGYYLRWIFIESPAAAASGECIIPTYTGNGDEMYNDTTLIDVELKKGWNLIKYEITETFTSQAGKTYPSKTKISRLEDLPEDVQWVAIGN